MENERSNNIFLSEGKIADAGSKTIKNGAI